jgi:F-type H+-transporting ATPase subunit b
MTRIIILSGLFLASSAYAAGGEATSGFDAWKMVIYHAINLVILLGVIIKFAGPTVREALKSRAANGGKEIEDAAALHADAKQLLADYSEKLAGFEAQRLALLDDYRAMGEAERDKIIADAKIEASRVRSEAERIAQNESTRAKERLEAEIVDRAVNQAEEVIRSQLSEDDHRRLMTEYFGQLESSVGAAQ